MAYKEITEMNLEKTIKEILSLLVECREENWSTFFEKITANLCESDIKNKIRGIYGGMGSFNDLVLTKNKTMLINENERLDSLRKHLFDLVS